MSTGSEQGALPIRAMAVAAVLGCVAVVLLAAASRVLLPPAVESAPTPVATAAAIPSSASDADGWTRIGIARYGIGDYPGAADAFREVIRLDPTDAAAAFNLGTALDAGGDTAAARDQYVKATELDPGLVDAHFNLAVALAKLGDEDGAIDAYKTTLLKEPGRTAAQFNLGLLLYGQGRLKEARSLLSTAIEGDPSYADRLPEGVTLR